VPATIRSRGGWSRYPLARINDARERLVTGKVRYRAVVQYA
jgi:D-arabinose 1-dehydrogenase-like Zn-dependent alcohol dehydrogenase